MALPSAGRPDRSSGCNVPVGVGSSDQPSHRSRRIVEFLFWVVPALSLTLAGAAKFGRRYGPQPQILQSAWEALPYHTALQVFGVAEIAIAIGLGFPAARRVAAACGLFVLSGISVLVALSIHDSGFVWNCPCYPRVLESQAPSQAGETIPWAHLISNALLVGMLIHVARTKAGVLTSAGRALGGVAIASIVAFALLLVAAEIAPQYTDASESGPESDWLDGGALIGHRFPHLRIELEGGEEVAVMDAFPHPGSVVLFSPGCLMCRDVPEDWLSGTSGHDVAILSVGQKRATREFAERADQRGVRVLRLANLEDFRQLGIRHLPCRVLLNTDGAVVSVEAVSRR